MRKLTRYKYKYKFIHKYKYKRKHKYKYKSNLLLPINIWLEACTDLTIVYEDVPKIFHHSLCNSTSD